MYKRVLAAGTALAVALLGVSLPGWAAPLLQWRAVITYPEPGMTVRGIVEIKGYATHVNLDHYQVLYAPGTHAPSDPIWEPITEYVAAPVENNVLCTWDTTQIPNGPYVLILVVWGVGDPGNPYEHIITYITVDNSSLPPSPEPTLEGEPAATVPPAPTPTPPSIAQPPTSTPRPSPGPESGVEEGIAGPTPEAEGLGLDTSMLQGILQDAFCTGGLITVMLFLLWGLYVMAKATIRWYMRGAGPPHK
jgi:hypothetical protein